MAQLIVRNLEDVVKRRLRAQAKRHGHSMEEEVRVIIREAVNRKPPLKEGLGTRLTKLFSDVPKEFKIVEMRGGRYRIPKF
jgi:plasmid stability protein